MYFERSYSNDRSRSYKVVVDFSSNRKRVCNFLMLVININRGCGSVVSRFRDIASFLSKTVTPSHTTSTSVISRRSLGLDWRSEGG